MSCSVANPLGCVSSAAKSVAGDAFAAIARDFAKAADSTVNWLWTQMSAATAVHLGGRGFDLDLGIMIGITGIVAVGLFVIQVMASVLRRDPSGLGRALRGLVIAFIAGGVAITVTNLLLSATDALAAGVVRVSMGTTINQMGHRVLATDAITSVGNPAGMFLLSIAAIVAAVTVWAALLVRKALIVVSAIFAPLAFAGSLADITVSWTRRWIEIMVALIMSKLVLVMIFIVGWSILDSHTHVGETLAASHGQHITQTATGLLVLAMAGFAPWMALKLVHFSGEQFHNIHTLAGHASSGARGAAAVPQKAAAWRAAAYRLGPNGRVFPDHQPQSGSGGPAATQQLAAGRSGSGTPSGGSGNGSSSSGGSAGPQSGGSPGPQSGGSPGPRAGGSPGPRAAPSGRPSTGANGTNGSRSTTPLPQPPPPSLSS